MIINPFSNESWYFFFLLLFYIPPIIRSGFLVTFTMKCDDFCYQLIDGNDITEIPDNKIEEHRYKDFTFSKEFSFLNPIILVIENRNGEFGLGGSIDFKYFTLSSDDYDLWSLGKEGEKCTDYAYKYNGTFTSLLNVGETLNGEKCTCTLNMERCNPINEVTYITYTTPDISYNIKDLLLVRWSEAECNNIKTVIAFSSLQGGAFHVEGNTISDGDIIPLDKPLKYVSKGDETTIGKTDIAKLDYKDESGTYTLVSCERRIITCGLNCARCDENKCIECMNGYSFLESLESTGCVLKSDYDTEYQYESSSNLLYKCYESCDTCNGRGNDDIHNCTQCKAGYYSYEVINDINIQVKNCVNDCTKVTNFPYLNGNECVAQCDLLFRNECVSSCPDEYIVKNNECKRDLHLIPIDADTSKITTNIDESIAFIGENIKDFCEENKTIKGDGFIAQIYPIDSPPDENDETSSIDFGDCEVILRRENKIPDEESLIIAKYDIINSSSLINQVEYKVYSQDGTELDLAVCDNVNIDISYPLTEIDLIKAEEMSKEGVDIFDSSDSFFNDICSTVYEITLTERRKKYYRNITLCENNCEYKGINYDTKRVNCDCETKVKVNTTLQEVESVQNNNKKYNTNIAPVNIVISKCYNVFFDLLKWKSNIGLWLSLFILLCEGITLIITGRTNLIALYAKLNKYQKSSPSTIERIKDSYEISYNKYDSDNKLSDNNTQREIENQQTLKEQERIINDIYISKPFDIDNYPYFLFLLLDSRNCLSIFVKVLKEKNIFLRAIFPKSPYELISINFCVFLFHFLFLFTINALLYTEKSISNKQNSYNALTIEDIFYRPILSMFITYILIKLFSLIQYDSPLFDSLVKEIKDNYILGSYLSKALKVVREKIFYLYFVILLFSLYFMYYLTIFCSVYHYIQFSWFISGWISIGISFALSIIYAFMFSTAKIISLKCKLRRLYNVLLFFNYIY